MLAAADILAHPRNRSVLGSQAAILLKWGSEDPLLSRVFATQQRYMMAQLALAMAFESGSETFLLTRLIDAVQKYKIASRNTAENFAREMVQYRLITPGPPTRDRRARPLQISPKSREGIERWLRLHLHSLDSLDDGARLARYDEEPALICKVHPGIIRRLVGARNAMEPTGVFALFTWMNDGGLLMDKMLAHLGDEAPADGRVMTTISSFQELSEPLRISRTHLARKLAFSEREGHLGWTEKRGASTLWLSSQFVQEYDLYQAEKLAAVDGAFHEAVSS